MAALEEAFESVMDYVEDVIRIEDTGMPEREVEAHDNLLAALEDYEVVGGSDAVLIGWAVRRFGLSATTLTLANQ